LLPPESAALDAVAQEVGIGVSTLERWRSEALAKPAREQSLSGILCARHYMTSVYRSTYAKQDKDGRHGRDGTAVDSEGVD
jgi:hypothetical protein